MRDVVMERVSADIPLLGICVGMQLLADVGLEDGEWEGLGLVPGRCERLPDGVKLPHIGWNTVAQPRSERAVRWHPGGHGVLLRALLPARSRGLVLYHR